MTRHLIALSVLALAACVDLPEVETGECGNGVVEPELGEDCDRPDASCGAPDSAAACRLRCGDASGGAVCPDGAACGIDDVCRIPAAQFTVSADLRWTSPELLLGDTTGDDYPELLGIGSSSMEVRPGSPEASYGFGITAPNLSVTDVPSLGDLDGDGRADAVLPVSIGLFTMLGDPQTVMQPLFQQSFPLPVNRMAMSSVTFVDGAGLPASEVLAVIQIDMGPSCPAPEGCQGILLGDGGAELPEGYAIEDLAPSPIAWAHLPTPTGAVGVALAFRDDASTLDVDEGGAYSYIGNPDSETLLLLGKIPIPGDINQGVWAADVDGDDLQDLVLSITDAAGEAIYVAWGRSDGGFDPVVSLIDSGGIIAMPTPLAWGDADGDGKADLITADGVLLNNCFGRFCGFAPDYIGGVAWKAAIVADLDGNAYPDIAAHDGGTTLDIRLGTATRGLYNAAPVAVPGEISALRAGDFDGNAVDDLALVTHLPDVDASEDLHVAFGDPGVAPHALTFMGHIGTLLAIDNAMAPVPGQLDAIEDLVVVGELGGQRGGSLVLGSTSRRMVAPLIPSPSPGFEDGATVVQQVVTTAVDADGQGDVVVIALALSQTSIEQQVRVYRSDAYGALVEATVPGADVIESTAFNINPSKWVALPRTDAAPATLIGADGAGRVIALTLTCDEAGVCAMGEVIELAATRSRSFPTGLHAADVDGDGDLDVIASFGPAIDGVEPVLARASILRNDGGFTAAGVEELDVPVGHFVIDLAAIDLELDGTAELLVVTRDDPGADELFPGSVYLVRAGDDGAYGALEPFDPLALAGVDVTAGLRVMTDDVNGDRLADITLLSGADRASPRRVVVALQLEQRPGDVAVSSP